MEILDIHGSLIMCMFPNMLDAMRGTLLSNLVACLDLEPSHLQTMDSGASGETYSFEALHFSYYNRHCTRVRLIVGFDLSNVLLHRATMFRPMYTQIKSPRQTTHGPTTLRCCRTFPPTLASTNMSTKTLGPFSAKCSSGCLSK